MSRVESRQLERESLFLLAQAKVEGDPSGAEYRVKIRNLSPAGLMAEGELRVTRGSVVAIQLGIAGWVRGTVAWKQGERMGVAFAEEIDPELARGLVAGQG